MRTVQRWPSFVKGMLLIGAAALLPAAKAGADNWQANIKPGSEIVMNDLRWPEWDAGTYYCFWYMSFYPAFSSLYGGVAVHGPDKVPGMFTSYWCVTETVYEGEEFYGKGFGAEGSKGGANGSPEFQRPNAWYRMVMRTFAPTRGAEGKTNVGWWIKDVENNRWYTHSVLQVPKAVTGFVSNSGFVEALAPETVHRAFERRLGYCRLNGEWHDSHLSGNVPGNYKLIDDDRVVRYDRSARDGSMGKDYTLFPTQQPPSPILDQPAIEQADARAWGSQVSVTWSIPHGASPQLSYRLEAFADREARGQPLATWDDAAPHILAKRMDTVVPARSVRLTVTDIFDQQVAVVIPVVSTTLPEGASELGGPPTRAGLSYAYYEEPEGSKWVNLPDFPNLIPVKQGLVTDLDDTVRGDRASGYALRYWGYLDVPEDGLYVLSAGTSDGSRIYIDGRLVVDNDGIHSTSTKQYPLSLPRGERAFELQYFKGAYTGNSKQGTTDKIRVGWEGPGIAHHQFTGIDFRCAARPDDPPVTLHLEGAVSPGPLPDNLAQINVHVEARGHSLDKVQLFSGQVRLTSRDATDIDDEGRVRISVLLPAGKNRVWARLWFGDGRSVDSSNELELTVRNQTVAPWQFTSMEEGVFPLAVRSDADSASFMGEGFGLVHQTVAGDFTLTARIADMPLTSSENGLWKSNWLGLTVLEKHSNPKIRITDKSPYDSEISLFLTAGGEMKGRNDFPDLGGGRQSMVSFDENHRWLRLVRRGRRFQAYTSPDGQAWQLADERIASSFAREVYAGVCFRSGPNKSRSLFQGTVDNITLSGEAVEEERRPPRPADLELGGRVTAVIQSHSDPQVLYARSVGDGLVRSSDQGETWAPANGGLETPDAMAVRSVAVHPLDSSIVLRAGGCIVGGVLQSGLWRSLNAGQSWQLVTRGIDFDGRGPTTMFGEVVTFCPHYPDLAVAGGEGKGLFISRDAGETWALAGLPGERITSMAFSPKADRGSHALKLVVGTIADREFETLGLGSPASPSASPGRIYWLTLAGDQVVGKPRVACELESFGVTNMAFDMERNFVTFATTRGVYYTWVHGAMFAKRPVGTSGDRLFTAIGARAFDDWSRFTCAAPFSGNEQAPLYFTENRSRTWSPLTGQSRVVGEGRALALNAGISCVLPDAVEGGTIFLCNRHGVFKTTDRGLSFRLVHQ